MKFTLSWLRTHLQTDAPLERIAGTLSAIGLEVERVETTGAALAPFRIARVIEAVPHPNADRLRVCRVEAGAEEVQVVCGAPNARTGMRSVLALPGAVIPGTGVALKVGEIRGVASRGMLLSAREMGLGTDHDGIMDLPADAPVGVPYPEWAGLDDPLIEIGVTPNRGDALAVRGVARDLAAAGQGTLVPWVPEPVAPGFASSIRWENAWPEACPWIMGREIRGVRNGPSPEWLQRRLRSVGLRPISALVDVTNFLALDLGRPLHVFDADRIAGDTLVLRPGHGETLATLAGVEAVLAEEDLVIADALGVQSVAGIAGGTATAASDATTRVFLECALFDPVRIARSGRRLRIASEARARFERGIDPSALPAMLEAATAMILDLCGGEAGSVVAAGAEPPWRREASLRFARLASLGGAEVPPDEAAAVLTALGFETRARDAERIVVAVPPWRNDIAAQGALAQAAALPPERAAAAAARVAELEGEAELVEEVLRIRGLDRIPARSLPPEGGASPVPGPVLDETQRRTARLRRALAARGLAECVTFSFTDAARAAAFGGGGARLENPIASDLDTLRPSPLVTLAEAAGRAIARGLAPVALFEIGPGFAAAGQEGCAAVLRAGEPRRRWDRVPELPDAFAARADLWALLAQAGVPLDSLTVTTDAPGWYHPGQSGTVRQGPKLVLGWFGVLHPLAARAAGIEGPACAVEAWIDRWPLPKRRRRAPPPLEPLQPLRRDFAFLLPEGVSAEQVVRAVRGADRHAITSARVFDVFAGSGLPQGTRSLGVEVVFQPRTTSFRESDLESLNRRVVDAVAQATGATLR